MKLYQWVIGSTLVAAAAAGACSSDRGARPKTLDGDSGSSGSAGTTAGTGATGGTGGTGGTAGSGEGGSGNIIEPPMDADKDACAAMGEEVKPVPPVMHMVMDTSGSMLWDATNEMPDIGEPTKWDLTKDGIRPAVEAMPETLGFGLSFYPNIQGGMGNCIQDEIAVPIAWLTAAHKATVTAALDAEMPLGGTPTHLAWRFGYDTVKASMLDPLAKKFVVLVTDGEPTFGKNCEMNPDNSLLVNDIGAALTMAGGGIGTFILGVPGSGGGGQAMGDARTALSQMAEAGGTAPKDTAGNLMCSHAGPNYCHFDMNNAGTNLTQALIDALKKVTTSVISDILVVPDPPVGQQINTDSIKVWYTPGGTGTPELVPKSGPPCTDGWYFTDDTLKDKVQLCGPWRERIVADSAAKLVIEFDCKIISGLY